MLWIIAILGGSVAGGIFYGGLWWTVAGVTRANLPAVLLIGSFFVRSVVVMVIFYGVLSLMGDLLMLVVSLAVFFGVRMLHTLYLRPRRKDVLHAVES